VPRRRAWRTVLSISGLRFQNSRPTFERCVCIRGHFSGGSWNDALDKWGGHKHQVMLSLGERLGDGTHAPGEMIALMGAPDEVLARGEAMFSNAYRGADPRVRRLLVYYWRGGHDFLFFASDGSMVLASGWWAALE